jgi:superfamily II DNA or RNA helicase
MVVKAEVASSILLPKSIPHEFRDDVIHSLTIPNSEKEDARNNSLWGWKSMPDYINLWSIDQGQLVVPRGFASQLEVIAVGHDIELCWQDNRTWEPKLRIGKSTTPYEWQKPAIEAIKSFEQGFYKAPAGSGKTACILFAIKDLGCKSLVIVNTKDILWQWQERATTFLGEDYPIGQIGDGIFEISPYLTIGTAQTIHSRCDDLKNSNFFQEFSFVCLDEAHHSTAATYNQIVNSFSARYRVGVSATPDKTGDFRLATAVLGPIFHETVPSEVDSLIKPRVVRVKTDFQFNYHGAIGHKQSNYTKMIKALVEDEQRNTLICDMIMANQGSHQLVISKRLGHLDTIHESLAARNFLDPIYTITGSDDNDSRKLAKASAEKEPCLILSTLADEALDIPRLDRLHLVFPQSNMGLITQQVGRVERIHPEKQEALIYDYIDTPGPLMSQASKRVRDVYKPRKYTIDNRMVHDEIRI